MVDQQSRTFEGFTVRVCRRGDWLYVPTMDVAAILGMNQFTVRNLAKRTRGIVVATLPVRSHGSNRHAETLCVRVDTLQRLLATLRTQDPQSQAMLECCQEGLVEALSEQGRPASAPEWEKPQERDEASLDQLADRLGQLLARRVKTMVGETLRRVGQAS